MDADDYILPEKIARQVQFLEETGADVVYGDWRYQRHLSNGSIVLDKIKVSEYQTDILASLLANWWVALSALLYRRNVVENSGGWDESLTAAQDRAFFISVVMNEAKVVYQPGCYAIYRRHGSVTVSTSSTIRWIKNHYIVVDRTEKKLLQLNKLSLKYRHALAKSYFELARHSLLIDYSQYLKFLEETLIRFPEFDGDSEKFIYKFMQNIFGFRRTERIACYFLYIKKFVTSGRFPINSSK